MMQRKSGMRRNYMLVDISQQEKKDAKVLAKTKGMSLQGFVGQLIKRELENAKESGDAGR